MDPSQKFRNIVNGHCNFIKDLVSDILDELSVNNYKKEITKSIFFQENVFPLKTLIEMENFEKNLKNKVIMKQNILFILKKLKLPNKIKCIITVIKLIMNLIFDKNLIKTFTWTGRIRKNNCKYLEYFKKN